MPYIKCPQCKELTWTDSLGCIVTCSRCHAQLTTRCPSTASLENTSQPGYVDAKTAFYRYAQNGCLTFDQLRLVMEYMGFNLAETIIRQQFNFYDQDRSNTIELNEFMNIHKYLDDWRNAFQYYDKDRSGTLEVDEIRTCLINMNVPNLTQTYVQSLFGIVDKDRDGKIDINGFITAITIHNSLNDLMQKKMTLNGMANLSGEDILEFISTIPM